MFYFEGSSMTLVISATTFTSNTGKRYGGVIGIQGGTLNRLTIGASVTFTGNTIGPVGAETTPFTGRTVVCAATAAPPASAVFSSIPQFAPLPLASCFDVLACKDICFTEYAAEQNSCDAYCEAIRSVPMRGTWVEVNSSFSTILANPSDHFICNEACWSE